MTGRGLAVLAVLFVTAVPARAAEVPTGWKIVRDARRHCQLAVPADWTVAGVVGTAPGGAASARLGVVESIAWAESKARAKQVLAPRKVIEDRPQRLWFAFAAGAAGPPGWYASVPGKGYPCTAEIHAQDPDDLERTARRIVDSLGPAG